MYYQRILLTASLFLLPLSASYAFLGPDTYAVVGVKGSDSLNLRATASSQGKIVTKIPFNAIDVRNLGARNNGWCNVQYGNAKGWVSCSYLAEPGNGRYYTAQGYERPLPIQKEAKLNSSIVSRLPLNAKGITGYAACANQWCRISYQGYQGFVEQKYLMSARPSAPTPAPVRPPVRPPVVITPQPR